MILEIIIAIVLAFIVLNNLAFFGGLIALLLSVAGVITIVVIAIYFIKDIRSNDIEAILIGSLVLGGFWGIIKVISVIFKKGSDIRKKFYDLKTILKFLLIQVFSPGFTDKQKINKIQKINELVNYGKKKFQLLGEEKKKAKTKKFDGYFLKCEKDYDALINLINKEMSEYIKPGYINLGFFNPTRNNINGRIVINTKRNDSIIEISISIHNYKVIKNNVLIPIRRSHNLPAPEEEFSSTRVKRAVKEAKKYLLRYFKLHPAELEE